MFNPTFFVIRGLSREVVKHRSISFIMLWYAYLTNSFRRFGVFPWPDGYSVCVQVHEMGLWSEDKMLCSALVYEWSLRKFNVTFSFKKATFYHHSRYLLLSINCKEHWVELFAWQEFFFSISSLQKRLEHYGLFCDSWRGVQLLDECALGSGSFTCSKCSGTMTDHARPRLWP